jgi:hypothetical protein
MIPAQAAHNSLLCKQLKNRCISLVTVMAGVCLNIQVGNSNEINPLTPNGHYSGRTAPLTSRRYIFNIYSTNIRTEYFKHAAQSPLFSLQNAVYLIMLPCLITVLLAF